MDQEGRQNSPEEVKEEDRLEGENRSSQRVEEEAKEEDVQDVEVQENVVQEEIQPEEQEFIQNYGEDPEKGRPMEEQRQIEEGQDGEVGSQVQAEQVEEAEEVIDAKEVIEEVGAEAEEIKEDIQVKQVLDNEIDKIDDKGEVDKEDEVNENVENVQKVPSHQQMIQEQPQQVDPQKQEMQKEPQEQLQIKDEKNIEEQLIQSKRYIQRLERQLRSFTQDVSVVKEQNQQLALGKANVTKDWETTKQSNLELRRKKLELELERTKLIREFEKLKGQNDLNKKKLKEVEEVGNVFQLKNTLQELKLLSETQMKEIAELKFRNNQQKMVSEMQESVNLLKEYQEKQTKYQQKIEELSLENTTFQSQSSELKQELQKTRQESNIKNKEVMQLLEERDQLKLVGEEWQVKWKEFESERETNRKARQLEQSIFDYQSQKNVGGQNQFLRLNVLSQKEEKKLLLKEYLIIQSKNKQLVFTLEETKTKLRRLQREQLKVQTNYIKKKQYIDLNAKYNKAKKCLEGTFQQLRQLKRIQHEQSVAEQVDELLQGVEARQCHHFIQTTNQIVSDLHQKINNIEDNSSKNSLQKELMNSQSTVTNMKKELLSNQRILHLMNDDIILKNRLIKEKNIIINDLRMKLQPDSQESIVKQKINRLERESRRLSDTVGVYETHNLLLIKEVASLNEQLTHWKKLYDEIKDSLTEKIELSLESKGQKIQADRMEEEIFNVCKQCELRKQSLLVQRQSECQETQTTNLYDFYYKEIKDCLRFLRQTSKQYDLIPTTSKDMVKVVHEIKDKFLVEFKEKYEKIQLSYRAKFEELRKEKAENEQWRTKARQDIRDQFQDIRDLVMSNRLINALRQAKNLIDYLENEVQKQDEEGMAPEDQEEGEEEANQEAKEGKQNEGS